MKICSIEGCGKLVSRRGWCNAHYMRWFKYGDPLLGRTALGEPEEFFRETVIKFTNPAQCLAWPYARNGRGYGTLSFRGRTRIVSRLACEAVHGAPAVQDLEAAHSCGKGHEGCCNPMHLRWATRQENADDRLLHKTPRKHRKLTLEQAREIVALKGAEEQLTTAHRYGVHFTLVSHIQAGRRWIRAQIPLAIGTDPK